MKRNGQGISTVLLIAVSLISSRYLFAVCGHEPSRGCLVSLFSCTLYVSKMENNPCLIPLSLSSSLRFSLPFPSLPSFHTARRGRVCGSKGEPAGENETILPTKSSNTCLTCPELSLSPTYIHLTPFFFFFFFFHYSFQAIPCEILSL